MKLSARSYPHPVLGNRDDVPNAAFQASLDMTTDREQVYIAAEIKCSSQTINSLITTGDAEFVIHVECSNTMFRRAYPFSNPSHRISIPIDNLNDAVEVNVFVRAARALSTYRIPDAHPDYGTATFEVGKGDVLAVAEGQVFHIESSFDSLSRIGSIMQITESESDDAPMNANFETDKIVIYLSKKDFADYKLLKSSDGITGPLTTAIVLPVLVEGLHIWREIQTEGSDDSQRWVKALTRKIAALGLENESNSLILAQKILELPVKRALTSAKTFIEGGA